MEEKNWHQFIHLGHIDTNVGLSLDTWVELRLNYYNMLRDLCYHVLLARYRICLLKNRLQLIVYHESFFETSFTTSLPAPKKPKVSTKQSDISASFRVQEFSSSLYVLLILYHQSLLPRTHHQQTVEDSIFMNLSESVKLRTGLKIITQSF